EQEAVQRQPRFGQLTHRVRFGGPHGNLSRHFAARTYQIEKNFNPSRSSEAPSQTANAAGVPSGCSGSSSVTRHFSAAYSTRCAKVGPDGVGVARPEAASSSAPREAFQ